MIKFNTKKSIYYILIIRVLFLLLLFNITRWVFYWVNLNTFFDLSLERLMIINLGGLRFDISAICYLNALFILLYVIPTSAKYRPVYHSVTNVIFIVMNSIGLIANLIDAIYFPFSNKRTSMSIFDEFANESNMFEIFIFYLWSYWYLTLVAGVIIWSLIWISKKTSLKVSSLSRKFTIKDYFYHSLITLLAIFLIITGIRGGIKSGVHPITISDAGKYTSKQNQVTLVINTPFAFIRTASKKNLPEISFFKDKDTLSAIYNPIHHFDSTNVKGEFKKMNVVILILESFSAEYSSYYNKELDFSYMPFMDSIFKESMTFKQSFANGVKSIDAMPSILGGIPKVGTNFILSKYVSNSTNSLPILLKPKGYNSLYAHGAVNGSMGFDGMAKLLGYDKYVGKDEYNNDDDYKSWGIWDHKFLPYFTDELNKSPRPFIGTIFTLSSHTPYFLPKGFDYPKGKHVISKVVQYTDESLKHFFEKIKTEKWYNNTLFIITADHTSNSYYPEFSTVVGRYRIPIAFYTPNGMVKPKHDTINHIQQTDILPTALALLGYKGKVSSFGYNVLNTKVDSHFTFIMEENYYSVIHDTYLLLYDFETNKVLRMFDFEKDKLLTTNIYPNMKKEEVTIKIIQKLKAFIQQYHNRMNENRLLED